MNRFLDLASHRGPVSLTEDATPSPSGNLYRDSARVQSGARMQRIHPKRSGRLMQQLRLERTCAWLLLFVASKAGRSWAAYTSPVERAGAWRGQDGNHSLEGERVGVLRKSRSPGSSSPRAYEPTVLGQCGVAPSGVRGDALRPLGCGMLVPMGRSKA